VNIAWLRNSQNRPTNVVEDRKISECLCIDLFAVSNKVQYKESESEMTTGNGNGLAAILAKNRKNGQKWDFDPQYLENSPTYPIDMYDIFDKADGEEFDPEEKPRNGSSFVRHFDEKPSITAENHWKSARVSRILAPGTRGPRRCSPLARPTPSV